MRNPKWQREELILALDLYFNLEPGQIHAKNPQIIKLSEVLNQLPINGNKNELEKFRNPNGSMVRSLSRCVDHVEMNPSQLICIIISEENGGFMS